MQFNRMTYFAIFITILAIILIFMITDSLQNNTDGGKFAANANEKIINPNDYDNYDDCHLDAFSMFDVVYWSEMVMTRAGFTMVANMELCDRAFAP